MLCSIWQGGAAVQYAAGNTNTRGVNTTTFPLKPREAWTTALRVGHVQSPIEQSECEGEREAKGNAIASDDWY